MTGTKTKESNIKDNLTTVINSEDPTSAKSPSAPQLPDSLSADVKPLNQPSPSQPSSSKGNVHFKVNSSPLLPQEDGKNNNNSLPELIDTSLVLGPQEEIDEDELSDSVIFPVDRLETLERMVSRPRWVVPVLPKGDLEVLIKRALQLAREGKDEDCEPCMRFYRDGLTWSFQKILFDDAVNGWDSKIQKCIYSNCLLLAELCAIKLLDDNLYVLELLAMVVNPDAKYHLHSISWDYELRSGHFLPNLPLPRPGVSSIGAGGLVSPASDQPSTSEAAGGVEETEESQVAVIYAGNKEARYQLHILLDYINHFGALGGFERLLERFQKCDTLNVTLIHALLKPFGLCSDYLLRETVEKYMLPVVDIVMEYLRKLGSGDLQRESKTETKNERLSGIVRSVQNLLHRVPDRGDDVMEMENLRLQLILRVLQVASFNGKMNALNELNKLISPPSVRSHRESDTIFSGPQLAMWIQKHEVLSILLRENLHQPQYVEKVERVVRFLITEKALSLRDLVRIWQSQTGKHEAIVKNIHDLLAKLAWDFTPDQLDRLFELFQMSWKEATPRERERLIVMIRRLAEEDKDGMMAQKVLTLLWSLASEKDCPLDIMELALTAHMKILEYCCTQDREALKLSWVERLVTSLSSSSEEDHFVIPILKQIVEIIKLFYMPPQTYGGHGFSTRSAHAMYRTDVIVQLEEQWKIVKVTSDSLVKYMNTARIYLREHHVEVEANSVLDGDSRFPHGVQVAERLAFIRYLLHEGFISLTSDRAEVVWQCLAEKGLCESDRAACFRWFAELMKKNLLDPACVPSFFENRVMTLPPRLLTDHGMECFDLFFRDVNTKAEHLIHMRHMGTYVLEEVDLIGVDYLWRSVEEAPVKVAENAINLLRELFMNLGVGLLDQERTIRADFISKCIEHLKCNHTAVGRLPEEEFGPDRMERMVRLVTVLKEFIAECDDRFTGLTGERRVPPLCRSWCERTCMVVVRFSNPNARAPVDEMEVFWHMNETLGCLRQRILRTRLGPENMANAAASGHTFRLDLYNNNHLLEQCDDHRYINQLHIRDRCVLGGKLVNLGSTQPPSSPDSSSDSSVGGMSPSNHLRTGTGVFGLDSGPSVPPRYAAPLPRGNTEDEENLPGVLLSKSRDDLQFVMSMCRTAVSTGHTQLRDALLQLLSLLPADAHLVEELRRVLMGVYLDSDTSNSRDRLQKLLFGPVCAMEKTYAMQVLYQVLLPASSFANDQADKEAVMLTSSFALSGCVELLLSQLLSQGGFMEEADHSTRRQLLLWLLRLIRLGLASLGMTYIEVDPGDSHMYRTTRGMLEVVPSRSYDYFVHRHCLETGVYLRDKITLDQVTTLLPSSASMQPLMEISLSSATVTTPATDPDSPPAHMHHDDVATCREALECLSLVAAMSEGSEPLMMDPRWGKLVHAVLLESRSKPLRWAAQEQMFHLATRCGRKGTEGVPNFIHLLFHQITFEAPKYAAQSSEFFHLLVRLLDYARRVDLPHVDVNSFLENEVTWLRRVKIPTPEGQVAVVHESLLQGHLRLCKELLTFFSPKKKLQFWSQGNVNFIQELLEDFLFPASKQMLLLRAQDHARQAGVGLGTPARLELSPAVCTTPTCVAAACELIVQIVAGCPNAVEELVDSIVRMYYADPSYELVDWEYMPPVGARPADSFVGLKNAGATCYMNSILQQLFMLIPIRNVILEAPAGDDPVLPPAAGDALGFASRTNVHFMVDDTALTAANEPTNEQPTRDHNISVLRQIQTIFGHLAHSKLQFYVPSGFWRQFRLWGDTVNLREQHDALEFFNCLVDNIDEGLTALNRPRIVERVLGGTFADQKICIDCPHRYSREEGFTTLNVDIRNQGNLLESLEQYVKGDLLEGDNAYLCENCEKKVDTIKRLCIQRLPLVLAIQLKRFDYDWERDTAIKFNDYFEFPLELDMAPYTALGLARSSGDTLALASLPEVAESCTGYRLKGVVVHSGQASGGHYYSYIRTWRKETESWHWYKYDDNEVSDVNMDDPEEMRNQWFGGEFVGEVYDQNNKRFSSRKQKRWWNAYILFYERDDFEDRAGELCTLETAFASMKFEESSPTPIPKHIEAQVQRQNIEFLHNKAQFTPEFFGFIKRLALCPHEQGGLTQNQLEKVALKTMELLIKFIFSVGFKTKKTLRGPVVEWLDTFKHLLSYGYKVQEYFVDNVITYPCRLPKYLLECPTQEIRSCMAHMVVHVAHHLVNQVPMEGQPDAKELADRIIYAVLLLVCKEVHDNARHSNQYFRLFFDYMNQGIMERQHLLALNIPAVFISFATEEGVGQSVKQTDMSKLMCTVSRLVRCFDVTAFCQTSHNNEMPTTRNPYAWDTDTEPVELNVDANAALYKHPANFVKKILDDCLNQPTFSDVAEMIKFCCWENWQYSIVVLGEFTYFLNYHYPSEHKLLVDLTLEILLIGDSWQQERLYAALLGQGDVKSLMEVLVRVRVNQQKRCYHLLKMLVNLFNTCHMAYQILSNEPQVSTKLSQAVEWLKTELERRPQIYGGGQWGASGALSNDTSNSYLIERSPSAAETLNNGIYLIDGLSEETTEQCPDDNPECSGEQDDITNNPSSNLQESCPLLTHTDNQPAPATSTDEEDDEFEGQVQDKVVSSPVSGPGIAKPWTADDKPPSEGEKFHMDFTTDWAGQETSWGFEDRRAKQETIIEIPLGEDIPIEDNQTEDTNTQETHSSQPGSSERVENPDEGPHSNISSTDSILTSPPPVLSPATPPPAEETKPSS